MASSSCFSKFVVIVTLTGLCHGHKCLKSSIFDKYIENTVLIEQDILENIRLPVVQLVRSFLGKGYTFSKLGNRIESLEHNVNELSKLVEDHFRQINATEEEKYDCGMPPNISNPNIPTKEGNGSFRCQAVKNCEAVRCCNPSARDGEYEIYPELTSPHPIQVYCHSMSSTPREYITLHHLNQAFNNFSLLTGNCRWRKRSGDATTTFDKIRINITSMVVVEDDFTFTDITSEPTPENNVPRKQPTFGRAEDCSTWHTRCQKLGYFIINLKGTGLRLDPNLKWKTAGYLPSMDWFYNNGTVVEARCGGYCGWCIPSDPMRLFIDRADQ